jgi:excisionase family DNA binding protein
MHATPAPQQLLYKLDEVRALLRVGRNTVVRLRDAGELPPVYIGRCVRYRATDVERLAGVGGSTSVATTP